MQSLKNESTNSNLNESFHIEDSNLESDESENNSAAKHVDPIQNIDKLQNDQKEKLASLASEIKETKFYFNFLKNYQYVTECNINELEYIRTNEEKSKNHNVLSVIYVICTFLIYLIVIIGCILFLYVSFSIIFIIIMNGFCLVLYHKKHHNYLFDALLFVWWIFGSTPYVDVIIFINIPIILIFLNFCKDNKNAKTIKNLFQYGIELSKKNSFRLYLPMIILPSIAIIMIIIIVVLHAAFKKKWFMCFASAFSIAFSIPLINFLLILFPFPIFCKSIKEKLRNKFDCGLDNIEKMLDEENQNLIEQKKILINSDENQNIDNINDSLETNLTENENVILEKCFSYEDFFKNKNYFQFDRSNEIDHIITLEKLFYFFSIGEWYSFFLDQWDFFIKKKEYGNNYPICKFKIIMKWTLAIISIIFQIFRIIFDGIYTFDKNTYTIYDIILYTCRSLLKLLTILFIAISNFVVIFIDRKKIKTRYPNISYSKWISIYMMLFELFILIFSHIIAHQLIRNNMIKSFNYDLNKIIKDIDIDDEASICGINVRNFSIIQMAGLSMIASIKNENLQKNLTKQIFDENISITSLYGDIISGILVKKNENVIIAYPGNSEKEHIGILFDIIGFKYYSKILENSIPFYSIFEKLRKNIFWLMVIRIIYLMLLTGKDVTSIFINDLNNHLNELKIGKIQNPIFTGQMIGGVASKYLEAKWNSQLKTWSVSFESFSLSNSKIEHFAIDQNINNHNPLRMINVFSDSSLFSFSDEMATFNFEMPIYQSIFHPASSYETFCMVAAACTKTNRYDDICDSLQSKYHDFFQKWKRNRKWENE